jgi:hypothetical protein
MSEPQVTCITHSVTEPPQSVSSTAGGLLSMCRYKPAAGAAAAQELQQQSIPLLRPPLSCSHTSWMQMAGSSRSRACSPYSYEVGPIWQP